jgi:hypothetical protein
MTYFEKTMGFPPLKILNVWYICGVPCHICTVLFFYTNQYLQFLLTLLATAVFIYIFSLVEASCDHNCKVIYDL